LVRKKANSGIEAKKGSGILLVQDAVDSSAQVTERRLTLPHLELLRFTGRRWGIGAEAEGKEVTMLQVGDRVRVTNRSCLPGYHVGDKGTLFSGPNPSASGLPCYVVAMVKHSAAWVEAVFFPDEIEPDV
jgi:hypothetical protein